MTDSLPSWARVGAKVVCVDVEDYDGLPIAASRWLRLGEVFTIRGVTTYKRLHHVQLSELPNIPPLSIDVGWRLSRFRPLHTVETDTAMFLSLLTPDAMGIMERDLETAWEHAR